MEKYRKRVLVGIFVLAAAVTPPDPVTQILLAIPLLLVFEFWILMYKLGGDGD